MDPLSSPKAWAVAAAAGGGMLVLRWLANAPVPQSSFEERAKMTRKWFVKHLLVTHTFDQVVGGFQVEHAGADGTLRGTIAAEGPMLSVDGFLHEGGLMCLIDTLTSVAVMASGNPTGVTVDMSFTALAPVAKGESLVVEARTLRVGNTLAFTSCDVKRAGSDAVVAVGAQTKHIGMPWKQRLIHDTCARFLPLARYFFRKGMAALAASRLPRIAQSSMEEALALQPMPADAPGTAPEGATRYWAAVQLHLLNGYWAGHGASSAGLLAAAVREHLKGVGIARSRVTELSASYLRPVPGFKNVGVTVIPMAEGSSQARVFTAELCSEQGILLVRARLTAMPA